MSLYRTIITVLLEAAIHRFDCRRGISQRVLAIWITINQGRSMSSSTSVFFPNSVSTQSMAFGLDQQYSPPTGPTWKIEETRNITYSINQSHYSSIIELFFWRNTLIIFSFRLLTLPLRWPKNHPQILCLSSLIRRFLMIRFEWDESQTTVKPLYNDHLSITTTFHTVISAF